MRHSQSISPLAALTNYSLPTEENYGSVLKDCSKAIALNPQSSKAYYRSANALVALERYEDAIDCCERCLQFDNSNSPMQALLETARKLKEAKERKEREKAERIRREQEERRRLNEAFKASEKFLYLLDY